MMGTKSEKDLHLRKRTLAWYNMIPNLIWSILNLAPIAVYCYQVLDPKTFYIFLPVSVLPVFLKNSFLDNLQIGKTVKVYKQLGVHLINTVAQNGAIINSLIKRKYPGHKIVTTRKSSIAGLVNQTYIFEKFHLVLFIFFSLATAYALVKADFVWAFIIILNNVAYNVYPNLLQQYIRIKLKLYNKRINANYNI
jgi:hypothetical protein